MRIAERPVAPGGPARNAIVGRVVVGVATSAGGARPTLSHLHCSGALAARLTPDGLFLVGAGAHPVGDDRIDVEIDVGPDTAITVRSSGATLARRGERDAVSVASTSASVARGSTLCWLVEPGVAAAGARHHSRVVVTLDLSARLVWREEVVLGRFGEDVPGSWRAGIDVRRGERPLFVGELDLGPAAPQWTSASVFGGARSMVSTLVVDPDRPTGAWHGATAAAGSALGAALPLAGPGVELLGWGASLSDCRDGVAGLLRGLGLGWLPSELGGADDATAKAPIGSIAERRG